MTKNSSFDYKSSRFTLMDIKKKIDGVRKNKTQDNYLYSLTEASTRNASRNVLYKKSERFGNTNKKRRRSILDDSNQLERLFNDGGSILRKFAVKYYPFPTPLRDENGKLYYPHKTRERVYVKHSTLVEMDFIDVIRFPMEILCLELFKLDVVPWQSYRFQMKFVYRMRPILK